MWFDSLSVGAMTTREGTSYIRRVVSNATPISNSTKLLLGQSTIATHVMFSKMFFLKNTSFLKRNSNNSMFSTWMKSQIILNKAIKLNKILRFHTFIIQSNALGCELYKILSLVGAHSFRSYQLISTLLCRAQHNGICRFIVEHPNATL